ncbi:hypothetical protein J1614_010120, partial [Plenodomus biglobosus]
MGSSCAQQHYSLLNLHGGQHIVNLLMTTLTLTNPLLTAAIWNMERTTWVALCTSGGSILPHLSSNPVMIFWQSHTHVGFHAHCPGDAAGPRFCILGKLYTSALTYYCVEATRSKEKFHAICSSAWALEQPQNNEVGGWKMTTRQQTSI